MKKYLESGIGGSSCRHDCLNQICEQADHLHIKGCTFFKEDGSIGVMAQGEETDLVEFVDKLKDANLFFRIENFYITWKESNKKFDNFSIIY
jgi:acylphosphatase